MVALASAKGGLEQMGDYDGRIDKLYSFSLLPLGQSPYMATIHSHGLGFSSRISRDVSDVTLLG